MNRSTKNLIEGVVDNWVDIRLGRTSDILEIHCDSLTDCAECSFKEKCNTTGINDIPPALKILKETHPEFCI